MKGRFWPAAIISLLAANAVVVAITVRYALDNHGSTIESDYYQKAVHWDDHAAQLRHNAELGWHADVALTRSATGATATVKLTDTAGTAINGAKVTGLFFHNAYSDKRVSGLMTESGDAYTFALPAYHAGLWTVSLDVRTAKERFTLDREIEAVAPK